MHANMATNVLIAFPSGNTDSILMVAINIVNFYTPRLYLRHLYQASDLESTPNSHLHLFSTSPYRPTTKHKNNHVRRLLGRLCIRSRRHNNRQPSGHSKSKPATRRPRSTSVLANRNDTNPPNIRLSDTDPTITNHHHNNNDQSSNLPQHPPPRHRSPNPRLWCPERLDVHNLQPLHGFPLPGPLITHLPLQNLCRRRLRRLSYFPGFCTYRVDKMQSAGQ